jgi:pimeloyl-ACP methyl ester carboxylesterase
VTLRNTTREDDMRITSFGNDGLVFDVVDAGPLDGPVVVLLHGFPQTSSSWDAVESGLHREGFRTLAPDQRGYSPGARPRGRWAYRATALAGDVVALLTEVGRPVHLVGHDWGAAVAWSVAATRPDLVQSLTTVSVPHPGAFVRAVLTSRQAARSWYMLAFQLPVLPELLLRRGGRTAAALLGNAGMTSAQIDTVRREVVDAGALTGALNWYRGMLLGSPGLLTRKVGVPTTHLWSDQDPTLDRRGAELSERWTTGGFELVVLPGVSHWVPEEAPESIVDAVIRHAHGTGQG